MKPIYLWLILLTYCQASATPPPARTCKRDILTTYGLSGYAQPQRVQLEMCRMSKDSCCQPKDQLNIYLNWVHNSEQDDLLKHYGQLQGRYDRLFDTLNKVHAIASSMFEKLKHRKISNCKLIAERLLIFSLDKVLQ